MPLKNMLNRSIVDASPSTSVMDVAEMMKKRDVGAVLVIENEKPKGIVTDRDIVLRCVAMGLDPLVTPVARIMSGGVETVTLDDGIYDVAKKMRQAHVRRIAVVDAAGNATALLSFDDVFDLLTGELCDLRDAIAPESVKIVDQGLQMDAKVPDRSFAPKSLG